MKSEAKYLEKEILIRTIKSFFSDNFEENARLIPFDMRPKGAEVPYRCCIYKERAALRDRVMVSLGFSIEEDDERTSLSSYAKKSLDRNIPEEKVLSVLNTACKGCNHGRIYVTDLCQGCVARPCVNSCPFGAISIINGRSVIDQQKCKKCTKCVQACPYSAIAKLKAPCEERCPVNAIKKDENGHTVIDFEKCISCGKCVSVCPFGAVQEKSQIIDVLKNIKQGKKVIAMIAPSIAGQFTCGIYKLKTALKKCGFFDVYEVAQGADITSANEAIDFKERMEEGAAFMTTSCCAAYNELVDKHLPEIKPFRSNTKTPLYYTASIVKKDHPDCISVFVSPCVAKKKEAMKNDNVDFVLNFEDIDALFTALNIEPTSCENCKFVCESSKEAREYGLSKGVSKAVIAASKNSETIKPTCINGLNKESIKLLKKYAKNGKTDDESNLVEVMSCEGGCIGGNAKLTQINKAHKTLLDFTKDSKPYFNKNDEASKV